jgi:hypothetical protein
MLNEILSISVVCMAMTLVGIIVGFLLLKIQDN